MNEINRLLIPGQLLKRAMKGELGLLKAAKDLQGELLNPQMPSFDEDEGVLASEMKLAQNAKKVALMILGTAAQKYMMELQNQQEILINAADIIIDAYAMETAILRAQKLAAKGSADSQIDMAQVFCNDAMQRIEMAARNTIAAMSEGDEGKMMLVALKRFTKNNSPVNTIAARQKIADTVREASGFGTTLWFTETEGMNEVLHKLIATGQMTMCFNMMIYLNQWFGDDDGNFDRLSRLEQKQMRDVYTQCMKDWERFREDPGWMVGAE